MPVRLPSDEKDVSIVYTPKHESFREVFLKKMIFLPFNPIWQIMIQLCVLGLIILITYRVYYTKSFDFFDFILFYLFQAMFATDTACAFLHRSMKSLNKFALHKPRNMFLLTIDMISLFPAFELCYLISETMARTIQPFIMMKNLMRVIHLIDSLWKQKNVSLRLHLFVIIISHTLNTLLIGLLASVIWTILSCWNECVGPNWTNSLKYYKIDPHKTSHWFTLCYTTMLNIINHNWSGFLVDTTYMESLTFFVILLIGGAMHIIIAIAQVTTAQLQMMSRRFNYMQLLSRLNWSIKDWEIAEESKRKIVNYYAVIWKKRSGIILRPAAFKLLPLAFRKEVFVDIFWEALRHSHLFSGLDMHVKKEISQSMAIDFLLPGEYLFETGMRKHKMIYIISGVIELLSHEDDNSPILSFTSGTVLCEAAFLFNTMNHSNLRCATDCEVYSLELTDISKVFVRYRKESQQVHNMLRERVECAKDYHSQELKRVYMGSAFMGTSISRLKKHWRFASKIHKAGKHKKFLDLKTVSNLDLDYHSENLDLLVLTDNYTTVTKTNTCIGDKCPFILEPDSSFYKFLRYVHLIVVVNEAFVLPYFIFFNSSFPPFLYKISIFFDEVYIFNIYVQLTTAIRANNITITSFRDIVLFKLKSILFIIDLIAAIPYNYFAFIGGADEMTMAICRLPKILQCYKLIEFIVELKTCFQISYALVIFMKYIFIYLISIYYCACFLYTYYCFGNGCDDESLSESSPWRKKENSVLSTIYYSMALIMSVSISNRTPITISEMIIYAVCNFYGTYLHIFFLSEFAAFIIKTNESESAYKDNLVILLQFMRNNHITGVLKRNLLEFNLFKWNNRKYFDIAANKSSQKDDNLEKGILLKRIMQGLKHIPIFSHLSKHMLYKIAHFGVIRILPPGVVICKTQSRSLYLHVIIRGYCIMDCFMPGDIEKKLQLILKAGDMFPAIETMHNVNNLNTITSLTSVELLFLDYFQASQILLTDQTEHKLLKDCLNWHMNKYRSILSGIGTGFTLGYKVKSKRTSTTFEFSIFDDGDVSVTNEHRSIFEYFLFKRTIDPNGYFFGCWEVVRSIVAISNAFVNLFDDTVLKKFGFFTEPIIRVGSIIFVLDYYIRLHVQYYKENGILVHDRLKTAKHYVLTSFAVDLIAVIPLHDVAFYNIKTYYCQAVINLIINFLLCFSLLYRPICGISYLAQTKTGKTRLLMMLTKYIIISGMVIMILSNNILQQCCRMTEDEHLICNEKDNFITFSSFKADTSEIHLLIYSIFGVLTRFTGSFVGSSEFEVTGKDYESILHIVIPWICKLSVVAIMTGLAIEGQTYIIERRKGINNFISFVGKELVSEKKIEEFVGHFEYVWQRTEGMGMDEVLDGFPENYQLQVRTHLFEFPLKHAYFFENVKPASLQTFIRYMQLKYYKKDSAIIRCNDIQQMMFFICKGEIDVRIANCKVITLKRGGVFGCFSKLGPIRQTIDATSKYHVDLLAIDSNLFHSLLKIYPEIQYKIDTAIASCSEFIAPADKMESKSIVTLTHSDSTKTSFTGFSKRTLSNWYKRFNEFANEDHESYQFYKYLFHVHISPISCIILMFMTFFNIPLSYHLGYVYTVDLFYIINMVIGFHTYYTDRELGVMITDPNMVRKRYAKSFGFWVDLAATFPIELILLACGFSKVQVRAGTSNRVLRIYHMIMYYYNYKRQIKITISLQWACMFYLVSVELTFISLLWLMLICDSNCLHRDSTGPNNNYIRADFFHSIVLCYVYVLNIFTSCGLRTMTLHSINEVSFSIFIAILTVITTAVMCGSFTNLLVINGVALNRYHSKTERLKTYTENHGLSPILVKRMLYYMQALWQNRRGELMPMLISKAPIYLQQDIMHAMYGHHLMTHFLFKYTHKDFIKQLAVHFKIDLYTSKQVIVESGEVDECMYFIHRGEVTRRSADGEEQLLTAGQSFGAQQGLFALAHNNTYTAYSIVDLLTLRKSEWEYLLNWFPASKEIIFNVFKMTQPVDSDESLETQNSST